MAVANRKEDQSGSSIENTMLEALKYLAENVAAKTASISGYTLIHAKIWGEYLKVVVDIAYYVKKGQRDEYKIIQISRGIIKIVGKMEQVRQKSAPPDFPVSLNLGQVVGALLLQDTASKITEKYDLILNSAEIVVAEVSNVLKAKTSLNPRKLSTGEFLAYGSLQKEKENLCFRTNELINEYMRFLDWRNDWAKWAGLNKRKRKSITEIYNQCLITR